MDEMRDKMKGFMKKVNTPFSSSSSGKFKGQGRVLGSSSTPNSSNPSKLVSSSSQSNPKPPQKVRNLPERKIESKKTEAKADSSASSSSGNGFDPFNPLITSGKRNLNGYDLKVFECPVCGQGFPSEEEVSAHVEFCLSVADSADDNGVKEPDGVGNQLQTCVSTYLSGKPSDGSVEVVMKLLRNVVKDPGNVKFRRIRMANPKIKEVIGDVPGGVELLECIGFELREEEDEMFLVMDEATEERMDLINNAVSLLEPKMAKELPTIAAVKIEEPVEVKPVDRQVNDRIFFNQSVALMFVTVFVNYPFVVILITLLFGKKI